MSAGKRQSDSFRGMGGRKQRIPSSPASTPEGQARIAAARERDAKRQSGRDWRTMTPGDFDTTASPGTLFTLEPGQVPASDGCGTGDLLELA
jgi:hypothetical protein